MRKVFNFYSFALAGMFIFSVSSFAEKEEGGHSRLARVSANPALQGTVVIKAVDLKNDRPFLRVTEASGFKDYLIETGNGEEKWEKAINECKGGEQCSIRGKVTENPPSIVPEFVSLVSSGGETRKTKTGDEFKRVSEDELKKLRVKDIKACVGKDGKAGAWLEPDRKDNNGAIIKGKIWCGEIARDQDGKASTMSQDKAKEYCKKMGAELATGYPDYQNGKDEFSNEDSDYTRLAKSMGAKNHRGGGYSPYVQGSTTQTVLPNQLKEDGSTRWFWSSSALLDVPSDAYDFSGRSGHIDYYYSSYDYRHFVRCVVARR